MLGYNPPLATPAIVSVMMEVPLNFTKNDGSLIKLQFKENTDPLIQEKLNKAFEEIRPRIERDLILKVLTNSGGII
jgi:hypothetical protein